MIRFVRAIARLAVLVLIAVPAMPAAASEQVPHVAGGVFQGTATIASAGAGGGFFSPVAPTCTGGALAPAPVCEGRTASWSFAIEAGVGGHYAPPEDQTGGTGQTATVEVGDLGGAVGGPLTSVTYGTGGFGGYCGYSGGSGGVGTISVALVPVPVIGGGSGVGLEPPSRVDVRTQSIDVASVGWIQSAATLIPFHGIVESAGVTPSPPGAPAPGTPAHGTIDGIVSAVPVVGLCTAGTATGFTVVGAAIAIWHDGAAT